MEMVTIDGLTRREVIDNLERVLYCLRRAARPYFRQLGRGEDVVFEGPECRLGQGREVAPSANSSCGRCVSALPSGLLVMTAWKHLGIGARRHLQRHMTCTAGRSVRGESRSACGWKVRRRVGVRPSRHCETRLCTRKNVRSRCHNRRRFSARHITPGVTHVHNWEHSVEGWLRFGTAMTPPTASSRQLAMDRRTRDNRPACPKTLRQTQSVLLEDPHFTPRGHRFYEFRLCAMRPHPARWATVQSSLRRTRSQVGVRSRRPPIACRPMGHHPLRWSPTCCSYGTRVSRFS